MSADELDKMTSEQLKTYFNPYLEITHPDKLSEPPQQHTIKKISSDNKIDKANELFKQFGINFKIKKL